jgi:hypothetical protein
MQKNNIDWKSMTSEEIFHKKNEFINMYEHMKKMLIEMNDRLMEIEQAFQEAEIELANRGIE